MTSAPAVLADLPDLIRLLDLLFSQEAEFSPNPERQGAGLRMILETPSLGTILVLREGRQVIGMVNLLYTVSTFLGARVAILEDMIIHPDFRRRGAGSQLLQAALEQASKEQCRRITLLTDGTNESAISFYQQHGFGRSTMIPLRVMLPE